MGDAAKIGNGTKSYSWRMFDLPRSLFPKVGARSWVMRFWDIEITSFSGDEVIREENMEGEDKNRQTRKMEASESNKGKK